WLRPSMLRRSLTREPTWTSIGLGLSPFWRPGRRVCWCIAIFGRLPSQRQRSEMTNYTIVESRSTAMPIAHPKLKRENKTDLSTKPCSNCGRLDGRPDRPLGGERAVDLIDRAAVFERLAKSGHDDRVCVTRRWRGADSNLRSLSAMATSPHCGGGLTVEAARLDRLER